MAAKKHKVFVYGTLRQSQASPQHYIQGYKLYAYAGGNFPFPYITKTGDNSDAVLGELLEVSSKQLKELDKYEGVERGMYTRDTVVVHSLHGDDTYGAFVYAEASLHPTAIPSGDWFNRS